MKFLLFYMWTCKHTSANVFCSTLFFSRAERFHIAIECLLPYTNSNDLFTLELKSAGFRINQSSLHGYMNGRIRRRDSNNNFEVRVRVHFIWNRWRGSWCELVKCDCPKSDDYDVKSCLQQMTGVPMASKHNVLKIQLDGNGYFDRKLQSELSYSTIEPKQPERGPYERT